MLNVNDLRSKSKADLLKQISELKGQLLVQRFQLATGQLTEAHVLNETKKDIARVFTIIKEKEMDEKESK